MSRERPTGPISIRASKDGVREVDAPTTANAWQLERIRQGIDAARDGRVRPAEDVFVDIAARHGWDR